MPQVISFATFPDETAMQADYVFPDHHGLGVLGLSAGRHRRELVGAFREPAGGGALASTRRPRSTCCWPRRPCQEGVRRRACGSLAFKDEVDYVESKLGKLLTDTTASSRRRRSTHLPPTSSSMVDGGGRRMGASRRARRDPDA